MTNQSILLVEDNPDDEALTIRALRRNNVRNELIVARDGAEALEYLFPVYGGAVTLPGLILLDLHLPKVGGLEVLRRIREDERTQIVPVIVLSSSRL
jgi:two-component system response regulator